MVGGDKKQVKCINSAELDKGSKLERHAVSQKAEIKFWLNREGLHESMNKQTIPKFSFESHIDRKQPLTPISVYGKMVY